MFELAYHTLQSDFEVPLPPNFASQITKVLLSNIGNRVQEQGVVSETKILQVTTALLTDLDHNLKQHDDSDEYAKMASALFIRLSDMLPQSLKMLAAQERTTMNCQIQSDVAALLAMLLQIIDEVPTYDEGIFVNRGGSLIRRVYRSCLKIGITDATGSQRNISRLSLKLIRHLLLKSSDETAHLKVLCSQLSVPSPDEVFSMAVSHSKFQLAMSFQDGQSGSPDDSLRVELVQMLITCVSLAPELVNVDDQVNRSILAGFNAGLGKVDRMICKFYCGLNGISSTVSKHASCSVHR